MLSASSKAVVVAGMTPAHVIFIYGSPLNAAAVYTLNPNRQNGWAHRFSAPAEQKLNCSAANSSLAWSHSAARLQLRRTPRTMCPQPFQRDVLAATHNRLRLGQLPQLLAQCKRAVQ